MRILLVGEYSGFHNSLKHGLIQLGHEVTIVATGDGFKNYPADVSLRRTFFRNYLIHKFKVGFWKLSGIDLESVWFGLRFRESINKLKEYDIIQFINSNPFNCTPKNEKKLLELIIKNNDRFILSACGDDYEYVKYLKNEHEGYSILNVLKEPEDAYKLIGTIKYLEGGYKQNYEWLVKHCDYIVPSNTDYAMGLQKQVRATPIIKAPIVIDKFPLTQNQNLSTIEIFIGINETNYWKKGINYFEAAIAIIQKKYGDRIKVTVAQNLPYDEYIKQYDSCHILLDQVLCYDQGYNALEAMLKGKVVFAGGGPEYLKYHEIDYVPVIDATPDVDDLVLKLSELIDNPKRILELGQAAREYVIEHHDSASIAKEYLTLYSNDNDLQSQ